MDSSRPSKEPAESDDEEGERKVLWELKGTDFASIFVKVDKQDRITYMTGILRSGKEVPFTAIGEVEKAPIRTDHEIAWDVLRPNQPLIRVAASGSQRQGGVDCGFYRSTGIQTLVVARARLEKPQTVSPHHCAPR